MWEGRYDSECGNDCLLFRRVNTGSIVQAVPFRHVLNHFTIFGSSFPPDENAMSMLVYSFASGYRIQETT